MKNRIAIREEFLSKVLSTAQPVQLSKFGDPDFSFINSRDFFHGNYQQNWLVNHILVADQPAILGGSKKVLKTSILVDLAVSLGTDTKFLGQFQCEDYLRVGLISGESGKSTLQETFRRVCKARGIHEPELVGVYWSFRMPQLSMREDLDFPRGEIEKNELDVIILDPLYLGLLSGNSSASASNLFDMGPLLAALSETCLSAGATPIIAHHARKNLGNHYGKNDTSSSEPPELEDLAFSGIQEFARQWLLIGRREKYEPGSGFHKLWLNVGGSAGHSGCWALDIDEGQLREDFGGRKWDVTIRTATDERSAVSEKKEAEKKAKEDEAKIQNREQVMKVLQTVPNGETMTQISGLAGMRKQKVQETLDHLIREGCVDRCDVEKPSGRSGSRKYPGFRQCWQLRGSEFP